MIAFALLVALQQPRIVPIVPQQEAFFDKKTDYHGIVIRANKVVSDEAMFEAYSEADILLFCSTIEGFGMPILEAQTVGRVVVTSNISAMPEVAGDGACFVDPLSIKAIRAGIEQVLNDENYRNSLIINGLKNVKR